MAVAICISAFLQLGLMLGALRALRHELQVFGVTRLPSATARELVGALAISPLFALISTFALHRRTPRERRIVLIGGAILGVLMLPAVTAAVDQLARLGTSPF